MAPTLAFAHGTTGPTLKNLLSTATPKSPVPGSQATIEKVFTTPLRTGGSVGLAGGEFEVQQQPAATSATHAIDQMLFLIQPRKRF